MNREKAKEYLPIIQAFAEGRMLQFNDDRGMWIDCDDDIIVLDTNIEPSRFRIKPESKYRPFKTQEECWNEMHKHPDFGWVKSIHYNDFSCINEFSNQGNILRINISHVSMVMKSAFDNYTFTDGAPFGVKEE